MLEYYYRGVASWDWYYPYHYAPMASDFTSLSSVQVTFTPGEPFHPFEQLLAVQPSSSCRLLPEPYRWLMTDPNSPIADFYPDSFEVDLEGKRADWEGVVLISFIDEQRLLAAAKSVPAGQLSADERSRNMLGDIMVFAHSVGSKEATYCTSTLPAYFTSVATSNSTAMVQAAPPPLPAGDRGFVPAVVAGTKVGSTGPAAFPTLRTLAFNSELRRAGVNVFGSTSRKESLILKVKELPGDAAPTAAQVASAIVGQRAWVKWPYLQEALVVSVSDGKMRAGAKGESRPLSSNEADEWSRQTTQMKNDYVTKQGLELGQLKLLLHVRPCEGLVRQIDGTVEKRFGKTEVSYPLQMTLRRNPAPDPRFQADAIGADGAAQDPVYEDDVVMFLGRTHYGCLAKVLPGGPRGLDRKGQALKSSAEKEEADDKGRVALKGPFRLEIFPAPANAAQAAQAARRILAHVTVNYIPSGQVARRLGVSSRTLGRITGNVWVQTGEERRDRVDIGLCVKHGAKGLYVPDYCAPMEPHPSQQAQQGQNGEPRRGGWAYSDSMIRIFEQYKQKFIWVWAAIEKQESKSSGSFGGGNGGGGPPQALSLEELRPGMDKDEAVAQIAALRKWLKSTPLSRRPLIKPTAKVAPESAVRMFQAAMPPKPKESPPVELENVSPALLMSPLSRGGTASAFAGGTFEIADRVTTVANSGEPTFGSRGTVVGVYDDAVEVLFDQEFLGGTDLFGRCNGNFGAMLPADQLLNLSRPHAVKAEGISAPKMVRRTTIGSAAPAGGAGAGPGGSSNGGKVLSASEALAAASAALQGKSAPRPPAPKLENVKQPEIPEKGGSKGFSMGRGRGAPGPAPPAAQPLPPAPGSQPNAGAQLLAQLHRSASSSSGAPPPGVQRSQQQQHLITPLTCTAPPPNPRMPPQQGFGMQMPMPPPPGQMRPRPYAPMMFPPPPPPPGLVHPNQGNALLAQLQRGAGTGGPLAAASAAPAPAPPSSLPNPGSALLSQLQASSTQPRAPAPPPAPNAGSLLLQQLQKAPAPQPGPQPVPVAPAPAPAASASSGGDGGLDRLWQQLQQKHESGAGDGTASSAAVPSAPPQPVAPPSADVLWQLMSNANKGGNTGK